VQGTRYSILGFFTAALRGKTAGNGNTPVLPVTKREGKLGEIKGDRPNEDEVCGLCNEARPIHTHRNGIGICQKCNMRERRKAAAKESRGKLLRQAGTAIAALEQLAKLVGDPDHEKELETMQERIEEISVVGLGGTPANEDSQVHDSTEVNGEDSVETANEPASDRDANEDARKEFVIDFEEDGAPEEPIESATEVQSEIESPPAENAGADMVGVSEDTRQALLVELGWTPKEVNGIRVPPGLDPKAELDEALRQMGIRRQLGKTIE
jgi:hypothetical protein